MKKIKTFLYKIIFFAVMITGAVSCSNDIFYRISVELPLIEPRIKGSPTNFVIFKGDMYVATGKNLYVYNETEKWTRKSFSENIAQLAVINDTRIYALCYIDGDSSVTRKVMWSDAVKIAANEWEEIPGFESAENYTIIHKIYSANNKLYIGAQFDYKKNNKENDFNKYAVHVLYYDDSENIHKFDASVFPSEEHAMLYGAVFDGTVTYICVFTGIYADGVKIESEVNNFIGIIKLGNSIAAINREGTLYRVETTGIESIVSLPNDRWASGAITLWQEDITDNKSNKLLLVGRQDREYTTTTGYTYGYMELELDSAGSVIGTEFKEPGIGDITTVGKNESYVSSLGIIPINHIIQAPNGILYASTQQSGVWSYKLRDKEYTWNSEE